MRISFSGKGCGKAGDTHSSADLFFMIDGSWSVGSDFKNQLSFVKNVVDEFGGVSSSGAHAGVLVISTSPTVEINLNSYYDNNAFMNAVSSVRISFKFRLLIVIIINI